MANFAKNESIFSDEEKKVGQQLIESGQAHLFEHWPEPGTKDADKKRLLQQAMIVNTQYVGGIAGYVARAKKLLADSRAEVNPYDEFVPSVPTGLSLQTETKEGKAVFDRVEALGIQEAQHAAFVLVAGGLGERLGYNGIKVALPAEITTETTYLNLYAQNILALQARARAVSKNDKLILPLAIMTSGDTDEKTMALLTENNYYGLDYKNGQVKIVKQELVPSMSDNEAHFVLDEKDPFLLDTKPHGHGDVHMLLYASGIAERWAAAGKKWIVFFQDTNGLVFRAIPAALGASAEGKMTVNSLTVPRRPGEAVGAICKLTNKKTGNSITINVEYNQLDALMKGSGVKDEVDSKGFSKYPGNINVLVFEATSYAAELKKSQGIISEFVNPKYKNSEKTLFTKPTRLECMMQDYPKALGPEAVVGYTQFERWTSFSAVKNNVTDAIGKQKSTGAAESGATGEADIYYANRRLLASAGAEIDVDGKEQVFQGIKVNVGARVVLHPSFGLTQAEIASKVTGKVKISPQSTLVLEGENITVGDLELDGTLVVKATPESKVKIDKLTVKNNGWSFTPIEEKDFKSVDQRYQIRGYTLTKTEGVVVEYDEGGSETLSNSTLSTKTSSPGPVKKKQREGED